MTPAERTLKARLAANERWSRADGRAGTEAARAAFRDSFADAIRAEQPGLSEAEIARRAESRRRAFYGRLALRSAIARRKRKVEGD